MCVPPLAEQKAIAAFLDKKTEQIDRLIAKKKALIGRLNEKRTALITESVTGRNLAKILEEQGSAKHGEITYKDSGVEWLGQIPEGWEVMQFKDRCRVVEGQVDPTGEQYENLSLIAPDHIEKNSGFLMKLETAREQAAISGKYLFREGDILYSKIRPELNKVCIAPVNGLCSADMYAIRTVKDVLNSFLFYLMLSKFFQQYAVLESMRVAMPKINRDALGMFRIIVPPINYQALIVNYLQSELSTIRKSIDLSNAAIEKLQEYRTAVITAAVTGKIDVRGEA